MARAMLAPPYAGRFDRALNGEATVPQVSPLVESALDTLSEVRNGKLDLSWMNSNPSGWGVRAAPRDDRGLGLADINRVGDYGTVPDFGSKHGSMAPRGSEIPEETPALGCYDIEDKSLVWADNVAHLYDEAVARQWSSARDIPWDQLKPQREDLEKAMCQVCTNLTEIEFVAGDMPAKWMWRINHDFHEVKLFLATQIFDEGRHMEVFRKRALANGGGLLRSSPDSQRQLRLIMEAPNFTTASALMHILGEGFVLTLFRNGEMFSLTPVEKKIFRLCMQDEARHVAYGTMHLKYFLEKHPERENEIHEILQRGEEATFSLNQTRDTVEARAILAGGGLEHIDKGFEKLRYLFKKQIAEYLHRLKMAGIDRSHRLAIPAEIPV